MANWRRYEEMRPDELAEMIKTAPVAFWPLGLLEHHGWALPVGFDGVKADRICVRIAAQTGGVVLPVMWWGGVGGHGDFNWTFYQPADAARAIALNTVERLIRYGFRAIVLLMGHYPWDSIVGPQLDALQAQHPEVLIQWGTEASIGRPDLLLPGDHAAREEVSYGRALLPELVDMDAMRAGRGADAWPGGQAPASSGEYPGVCYDTDSPLFAQMGVDGRTATAERGEAAIAQLVTLLSGRINQYLGRAG